MNRRDMLGMLLASTGYFACDDAFGKGPLGAFFSKSDKHPKSEKGEDENEPEAETTTRVETPMIGDYTSVAGLNVIQIQGVGLVTGLDGTGGDPPPSIYRTRLMDDMRRRGIAHPNEILSSPNTALVLVRGFLPPLCRKGDKFDLDVRVPGNDDTKSLNGGWLMETLLTEEAIVPGQGQLLGHVRALAQGPILVSTGEGNKEASNALLLRGKILGGGTSRMERDLSLYLRNDFRAVRNSKRIASKIGQRFFSYDAHGRREPLAEAKTDQKVELKLQEKYKDNYPRYLQVVRNIAFREDDVAQRVRMQKLKERLASPETAEQAAIELEAIGLNAIPILKAALKSKSLEVRFHASIALAYLGEPDGVKVLAEAAKDEPAFRIFAFAAMAAIDDAESHVRLRELMNEKSAETRYGAFRALTTLDKNDPFVRGEKLTDEFRFHALETEGPPMIHLTNRRKAEVVLFGADQEFSTPMAVRAGTKILVTAAAGSDQVVISRYEVGKPDRREIVSPRVADVVRKVAEFGATYPDIAQMLVQASRQKNTPGPIQIDAVPKAGMTYERPVVADGGAVKSKKKTQVGKVSTAPNIFSEDKDFDALDRSHGGSNKKDQKEPGDESEGVTQAGGEKDKSKKDSGIRTASHETEDAPSKKKPAKEKEEDDVLGGKSNLKRLFPNPFRKKTQDLVEPEALN